MGFMDAVRTCLSKFTTISGRARRAEFWWFTLFAVILGLIATGLDIMLGMGSSFGLFNIIVSLGLLLPNFCVTVRRLHDQDRSGWWILVALVPAIGAIILLVFMILRGTEGDNRFGPDPLAGEY